MPKAPADGSVLVIKLQGNTRTLAVYRSSYKMLIQTTLMLALNSRHEWQQHSSWGFMIRQGHIADAYNVYQKPVRNALLY